MDPSTEPYTPEMEIYRLFGNFSGALRLPGSGWSNQSEASGVQVEGVCVGKWAKPACPQKPCAPPSCDHLKIALVNGGASLTSVNLRIHSCTAVGPGTAAMVDSTMVGLQRQSTPIVACGNHSQVLSLKSRALMVVECHCTLPTALQ